MWEANFKTVIIPKVWIYTHDVGVANDIAWNNVYKIDILNFHLQQQRFGESYNSAYHFTWFCRSPGYINTIKWKPKNDLL